MIKTSNSVHRPLLQWHNLNWKRKLNSNQLLHILYVTPQQPEIKSKLSKSLHNTSTTYKNLLFIKNIFNISYATHVQLEIDTENIILRYPLNLIFVKLVENNFRALHLKNLKSLSTISFCTTLAQYDFHYIRTTWFQGSRQVSKLSCCQNYITLRRALMADSKNFNDAITYLNENYLFYVII